MSHCLFIFSTYFSVAQSRYSMNWNFTSLSLQATADISQLHSFALHRSMPSYSWGSNASGNRFLPTQTLISYFYLMKQVKAVHKNAFKHTGLDVRYISRLQLHVRCTAWVWQHVWAQGGKPPTVWPSVRVGFNLQEVCVCLRVLQGIRLQSRSIRCGEGSETEAGGCWWLHPNNDCTGTVFTSAEIEQQSIFPHLTAPCLTQRHTHNHTHVCRKTSLKHSVQTVWGQ